MSVLKTNECDLPMIKGMLAKDAEKVVWPRWTLVFCDGTSHRNLRDYEWECKVLDYCEHTLHECPSGGNLGVELDCTPPVVGSAKWDRHTVEEVAQKLASAISTSVQSLGSIDNKPQWFKTGINSLRISLRIKVPTAEGSVEVEIRGPDKA